MIDARVRGCLSHECPGGARRCGARRTQRPRRVRSTNREQHVLAEGAVIAINVEWLDGVPPHPDCRIVIGRRLVTRPRIETARVAVIRSAKQLGEWNSYGVSRWSWNNGFWRRWRRRWWGTPGCRSRTRQKDQSVTSGTSPHPYRLSAAFFFRSIEALLLASRAISAVESSASMCSPSAFQVPSVGS